MKVILTENTTLQKMKQLNSIEYKCIRNYNNYIQNFLFI
jgi:hypothetical protein